MTPDDEHLHLIANGWRRLRSGRWTHHALSSPGAGRRRPFTTDQAITIQKAADATTRRRDEPVAGEA